MLVLYIEGYVGSLSRGIKGNTSVNLSVAVKSRLGRGKARTEMKLLAAFAEHAVSKINASSKLIRAVMEWV
jgi:hypothetical protein